MEEINLTREELRRYSRHLIMPEVGLVGQKKLKSAKVLLIGTGGLGSPLGIYLTAVGIGTIGLVDFDRVDFTNLQRQIIYTTKDVGRNKLEAAKEHLQAINPNVRYVLHQEKLTSKNAIGIIREYDVIVDGTDNFPTRYLVNDACVLLKKPNVYGSIFRFEGQVSVFWAEKGPCYRCLYPEPPPPGTVPSCAEGGVLGILPGIIGTMQANEVVKLILGKGEPLIGRLILFDALGMKFRELRLNKNINCAICGKTPTVKCLIDYESFCGEVVREPEWEISPKELKTILDKNEQVTIIDVREPFEYEICHLSNSRLISLGELPARMNELNSEDNIVLHCHHGGRSAQALIILRDAGFRKLKNLVGGIDAWAEEIEQSMARY